MRYARPSRLQSWELWAGNLVRRLDPDIEGLVRATGRAGRVTDTTDGNGNITFSHGLGGEPTYAAVSILGDTSIRVSVQAVSATEITVLATDAAGDDETTTEITVMWTARL